MNKPTKPISSPGKTDKFPPPLMRFLRSNVGNKSRRRSRANSINIMFLRKTKNTLIEEPSSPKVTCIGQVRVTRSNNKTTYHRRRRRRRNRLYRCLRNLKPKSCGNIWNKCLSFFRCCRCKNVHEQQEQEQKQVQEDHEHHVTTFEVDNVNQGLIISRTSPKNVFLLTRCRSAPYRSSSLGSIFREETIEKNGEEVVEEKIKKLKKIEKEEKKGVMKEEGKCNESDGCEESKAAPLMILSRCKSEPARRWDQLLN